VVDELTAVGAYLASASVAGRPLAEWQPLVASTFLFDEVRCQGWYPQKTTQVKTTIGLTGSHSGACSTANVSISVQKITETYGRKGIGRTAFAGIPIDVMEEGRFFGSYLNSWNLAYGAFRGQITIPSGGGVYNWCIFNAGPAQPGGSIVTAHFPQPTVRVQRRRTVGVGK